MKYNKQLIEFFKEHDMYEENMFNYLEKNTTIINYQNENQRIFIGCYYKTNKDAILEKIHLTIPDIYDKITMLISIHEITHAINAYKKLNKEFKEDITDEVLPMLYEKIYIREHSNEQEFKNLNRIDTKGEEYIFGKNASEELLNDYTNDFDIMMQKVKILVKKYEKKNN